MAAVARASGRRGPARQTVAAFAVAAVISAVVVGAVLAGATDPTDGHGPAARHAAPPIRRLAGGA